MRSKVVIDCFPEAAARYGRGYAIVAIDVVRATTTAITIAASGCRCFPVPNLITAFELRRRFPSALLAGEQRGIMPAGFDFNNSPTQFLARCETHRPVILLSSTGTRLCHEARGADAILVASLRNYAATAGYLANNFSNIAVIGAGSRGEFREEDQMCCAWIAERLLQAGYQAEDRATLQIVKRWSNQPVDAWTGNRSAAYLKTSGQAADLEFILEHVGDLAACFIVHGGEVIMRNLGADTCYRDAKRASA
jgi:2-phosphosulfolactate phosphatase